MDLQRGHLNKEGAIAFLDAYMRADEDADIELRSGRTEDGHHLLALSVDDIVVAALLPAQVTVLASICEDTLNKFPNAPESRGLPNLILYLRHAAERMESPQ